MVDIDWRGFLVPWVHGDLFVRPRIAPLPDLLTWEYDGFTTPDGEKIERKRPVVIHLSSDAASVLQQLDQSRWDHIQQASATDLFATPVKHFLVRAFFSDGMDQIMAHMTTIEAALGMRADFGGPAGRRQALGQGQASEADRDPGGRLERKLLIFFMSPDCPVCKKLIPIVLSLRRAESRQLDIVFASDGLDADHRAFLKRVDIGSLPYFNSAELGRAFRVAKLPYAVLLNRSGRIAAMGLVNSREQLESLLYADELGVGSLQEFRRSQLVKSSQSEAEVSQ